MSKMMQLTPKVLHALTVWPETRNSDRLLIEAVYEAFYGITNESFVEVIRRNDLPSFESIRRVRQKIQETREDLRAVKAVEDQRIEKQVEYLEYAREGGEIC